MENLVERFGHLQATTATAVDGPTMEVYLACGLASVGVRVPCLANTCVLPPTPCEMRCVRSRLRQTLTVDNPGGDPYGGYGGGGGGGGDAWGGAAPAVAAGGGMAMAGGGVGGNMDPSSMYQMYQQVPACPFCLSSLLDSMWCHDVHIVSFEKESKD